MVDETFDRSYQAARAEMNAGVDRGVRAFVLGIRLAFQVLNHINWDSPWTVRRTRPQAGKRAGLA